MPNVTDILQILESKSFSELQKLMMKNNMLRSVFYHYTLLSPQFEGDTYKAFYYANTKILGSINIKGDK